MKVDDLPKKYRALAKRQRYESLLKDFPIKISKSKGKGRCVIAESAIGPGTLIMEEVPVASSLFKGLIGAVCSLCLKSSYELLACPGCRNQTFYCSTECQDTDAIHREECATITHLPGICGSHSVDYSLLRLILRYIFARSDRYSQGTFEGTNFNCVDDMVVHRALFGDSWIASIKNAGIITIH